MHIENISNNILNEKKKAFGVAVSKLEGLSPLGTLSRGFSLTFSENGNLIKSVNDVKTSENIDIKLIKEIL